MVLNDSFFKDYVFINLTALKEQSIIFHLEYLISIRN